MRSPRYVLLAALVSLAAGCGDLILPASDDDAGGGDNGDNGDDTVDAGADVPEAAPFDAARPRADSDTLHVVELSANAWEIGPGQSVTFTVIASDDLGEDAIVAAKLQDTSGALYGTFADDGSFTRTLTLTYAQITETNPVGGAPVAREFTAVFEDRLGYTSTATTLVNLAASADTDTDAATDAPTLITSSVDAARD